ncbi:methyl-accepting chemotaxis protein [Parvibaculaceae bacterium PLY_AMNH_Bact1]|nr:methyl-accepting chemotaxis protein [Parvibaculaceae bacterium PLY_AMNH_Bact1]
MNNLSLSKKLPLIMGTLATLAAISAGFVGFIQAQSALHHAEEEKLLAILHDRASSLKDWYSTIDGDLSVEAENPMVNEALYAFEDGWAELGSGQRQRLQRLYIDENPHPLGSKDELDVANDGSSYALAHKSYHPYFRHLQRERGYDDVLLLDPDGNVVYSVFKEVDYATNVTTGEWKDTNLGSAFRAARDAGTSRERTFFDFKHYAPSQGAPAAFMSAPIIGPGNRLAGVIIFQMPVDTLNHVMNRTAGLGETGETFVVGPDHLMRSNSRFSEESTILERRVDTEPVDLALAGETGIMETLDYRDHEVFSAYTPVEMGNTTWAILVDQDSHEAMEAIDGLLLVLLEVIGITTLVLAGVGIWVGRMITKPILAMADTMEDIAGGDTGTQVPGTDRTDELGQMASAVEVFRRGLIERAEMRVEQENERTATRKAIKQAVNDIAVQVEASTSSLIEDVSSAIDSATKVSREIKDAAKRVEEDTHTVAAATEESQASLNTMSSSTEGMANSIRDISREMETSLGATNQAVSAGDDAKLKIGSLSDSVEKVSEVVAVITGIAEQTNLLALNATIEAARAGEAGKGFAVVASEVKDLANQTARSTDEIVAQISDIQQSTEAAVQSFDNISTALDRVQAVAQTIAGAVEKQNTATEEIASTADETRQASEEIAQSVASVSTEARKTSEQTVDLNRAIDSVTEMVRDLGADLNKVVRASTDEADRRLSERIEDDSACELVVNDKTYQTTLSDLSATAVRVARPETLADVRGRIEFYSKTHDIRCEADVIECSGTFIRLEFVEKQSINIAA